ncbi:MAG: bacteriohopanetetrol glucosamine biosynthesis glycosyltransferase HpnI [Acidobacteria bacterium]|nr:bacteriohopanetetrol glucosamine biosynthesis glycosyltransferase HpnI [Acidobacteriota bacterium]
MNSIYSAFAPQFGSPIAFWALLLVRLTLFVCVLSAIVYYGIAFVGGLAWFANRRKQRALGLNFTPPATIFKPVRGADAEAYENFASFCRQDYPTFQIIFGVREASDPAVPIIQRLIANHPDCDIALVISDHEVGYNAKVSNLQNMFGVAKHDVLLIADSDIRVQPDYLRRVIAPMQQETVGMVTCLYRGANAKTLAALLENIGISSTFGAEVCSSRLLEGIAFALGSTIVMRRSILERIGGFPAVADYLADDFVLGNSTAKLGYEVVLSDCVVEHISGPDTMATMLKHQLRWGRSTRISRPWGYRGLILTYGTATSLLSLLAWKFSSFAWWLLAITMFVRSLPAFVVGVIGLKDYVLARYFWLLPIRDLMTFGVWLISFVGDEIHWRGVNFRVLPGGKLVPAKES